MCSRTGRREDWRLVFRASLTASLLVCSGTTLAVDDIAPIASARAETRSYDIGATSLAEALDRFGEQSGLQVVYPDGITDGHDSAALSGRYSAGEALGRLLAGSGLRVLFANPQTVVILTAAAAAAATAAGSDDDGSRRVQTVQLGAVHVRDVRRTLPQEASRSAFGFDKPLLETPRSVSFISKETIELFGLASVEDLVRVVPGAFTPSRFGIQGGIDVRSVPADTFFRGMKRVYLQGHVNSVLSANDSIEVVRGPPSPIYGMGKVGGYTNVVPRTARASDGRLVTDDQGFVQLVAGSYDLREVSFGIDGPFKIGQRAGGYSVYGALSTANAYARGVPNDAQLLQLSSSLDRVAGRFRVESGLALQRSMTAGALIGRFTQAVADSGRYVQGSPLVNLDANGNGRIGFLEMHRGSPVAGAVSVANQPLVQIFPWQYDGNGQPLRLDQFAKVAGIPQTLYDYLVAHPEADPGGLLRAQGVGGPRPISGSVPIGMALDPRTTGYGKLDIRRFAAYERRLEADLATAYVDLVDDANPDFTIKNQLFFDSMNQFKESEQPFGTDQNPRIWEDKLTVTRRLKALPSWLGINVLGSLNYRSTYAPISQCFGDYSNNRSDATASDWRNNNAGMTPNTTFSVCTANADLQDDGLPYTVHGKSKISEMGAAVLFDIDFASDTHLLAGYRIDGSTARNVEYAGTLNTTAGTSANPGVFASRDMSAKGWDDGTSWSISLSQRLPGPVVPYATYSRSSLMLDNNINRVSNTQIELGHIGASRFIEFGVKTSLFDDRLFISSAAYEQRRVSVNSVGDPSLANTEVAGTRTRGWESELKWVPTRNFLMTLYALNQKTYYTPNRGGNIQVDARALGFQDVVDPATGEVIYPAEAFLYGGRAFVALPPGLDAYREKQGNPNTQLGFTSQLLLRPGLGITLSGNYLCSVSAGRLQLTELPEARVFNAGLFAEWRKWRLKADVFNLTHQRYFRARNGDTLADVPVSALPGRRFQFTVRREL